MSYLNVTNEFLLNVPKSITYATSSDIIFKLRTILTLTCLTFILIWYVKYLWRRRYMYYYSWNLPGPFALPFIGSSYLFFLRSKTNDILEILLNIQKNYPDTARLWLGPKLYFLVTKPEHIEKILTSPKAMDKDYIYKFVSLAIGEGLLTAKGQKWRKHRKVIMPAFNQKILDKFQEIFATKGEIFLQLLQDQSGNKDLNMFQLVSHCTLDIICQTALGLNFNVQKGNSEFGDNLDRMMEIITYRMFHLWHHLEFTWNWYPIGKEYERLMKFYLNIVDSIIKTKTEAYHDKINQKKSLLVDPEAELDSKKPLAFLDLILENSNFTEEELREEVNIFLIAGTDTTATALCCIFVMLGMFPDVQQKVLEEVLDIMGPDRKPVPSDLPHMKYTERVIKESLRLFPVAAFFLRQIEEDIVTDDITFPAGSSTYFGSVHIQRNPKYWSDPLRFDPDRFLPENVAKRHPCTYVPFSYGPRNCIGGRYALMNIKTILSLVVRKVKIFTKYKNIEEIKLMVNIVLRLKDGPQVWVENRY